MNRLYWADEGIVEMSVHQRMSRFSRKSAWPIGHFITWVALLAGCDTKSLSTVPSSAHSVTSKPAVDGAVRPSALERTRAENARNSQVRPANEPEFRFRNVTEEWKLDFKRYDDIRGQCRIQESTGGGVAVFDYDLDNRLDIFLTQGSRLPRKNISPEFSNELFRNDGHLKRVTQNSGLISHGYHSGCTVGDINEDGFPDLYVTAYGNSSLWRNNGDGTFADISESSSTIVDSWSSSAAFADVNADGLLDLYVATYLVAGDDPPKLCKSSDSPTGFVQCSPSRFAAIDDVLFINDGNGGFINATLAGGISGREGKGLGVLICDFDHDGTLEIFVANDMTPCFFYRQMKGHTGSQDHDVWIPRYEECAVELGVAQNGEGQTTAAMGIAHADYDRDGWTDFFITNFYLENNTLFRNLQGNGFIDMSAASRLGPPSRQTLAFGTAFLDVDHDGWSDLVITTGHVEDKTWAGHEPYRMRPHLFRNERNGKFTDVAPSAGKYFQDQWVGRGLALGDLDRDGDLDIAISHQVDPSVLLLNETPTKSGSVIIRPVGRQRSPRSGIGAQVVANGVEPPFLATVVGGGSFQSASALELHLGMAGRPTFQELELTWPDGSIDRWKDIEAGYYVAIEGRGLHKISAERFSR